LGAGGDNFDFDHSPETISVLVDTKKNLLIVQVQYPSMAQSPFLDNPDLALAPVDWATPGEKWSSARHGEGSKCSMEMKYLPK
jgi:hypothetical protein